MNKSGTNYTMSMSSSDDEEGELLEYHMCQRYGIKPQDTYVSGLYLGFGYDVWFSYRRRETWEDHIQILFPGFLGLQIQHLPGRGYVVTKHMIPGLLSQYLDPDIALMVSKYICKLPRISESHEPLWKVIGTDLYTPHDYSPFSKIGVKMERVWEWKTFMDDVISIWPQLKRVEWFMADRQFVRR